MGGGGAKADAGGFTETARCITGRNRIQKRHDPASHRFAVESHVAQTGRRVTCRSEKRRRVNRDGGAMERRRRRCRGSGVSIVRGGDGFLGKSRRASAG